MLRLTAFVALLLTLAGCADESPDAIPDDPIAVTSAEDLTQRMLARFADSFGDTEQFTVLAGGFRSVYTLNPDTSQMERYLLTMTPTDSASTDPSVQMLVQSHLPNVPLLADGFRTAQLSGPFERDGAPVYMLESDQAGAAVGLPEAGASGGPSMRLYVDARTFDIREIYRAVPVDSLERPITLRILYDGFQTTDGVRVPRQLRQIQAGFDQFYSDRDRMVQGAQLGLQKQQLQTAPPSPARDAQVAEIDRAMRSLNEGVEDTRVTVSSVVVGRED